jgi:TolB-like protein
LSRFLRHSFVISRNTAFTFKGKNIDTKEISKELGVCYVLEWRFAASSKTCS